MSAISKTTYADAGEAGHYYYKVYYLENRTNKGLLTSFREESFCRDFVRKLKKSKKLTLQISPF